MFPPELIELVIDFAWGCLSTSSHQHGLSMTRWMLVSHDWLNIVLSIVFRDLWITSDVHFEYLVRICVTNTSVVCGLVGITDIQRHLTETCRSLTISAYHKYQGEYADLSAELIDFATTTALNRSSYRPLVSDHSRLHRYAIESRSIGAFVEGYTSNITALHFVLIDCTATYRAWDVDEPPPYLYLRRREFPKSLIELHVTFIYTTPSPALRIDAPRGTFFPPPSPFDYPLRCRFHWVQKLVVRDANADFVAFLATACPRLEKIESTAEFSRQDVPEKVLAVVRDRLTFVRLPRTVNWGLTGSTDALPLPQPDPPVEQRPAPHWAPPPPTPVTVRKKKKSIWRWHFLERVKHVLRGRK
ncbi:hypothetical protein C8R45DRAFT_371412 [Mycena sanguinolenta]|nr:hypothetical protein C8R45DRAFT_371412 [Mycena sanguinolenta]